MKGASAAFLAALLMSLLTIAPRNGQAADSIIVRQGDSACVTTSSPPCYTTIMSAISSTTSVVTIGVGPGTYSEAITLPATGITLHGTETARTILQQTAGSGATISASNLGAATTIIENFTFINATVGIKVQGNSAVTIRNNVFNVGTSGTGIQLSGTTGSLSIANNTFFRNNIGIIRDRDIDISDNIFSLNQTRHISDAVATLTQGGIQFNDFNPLDSSPTGTFFLPNAVITNPDPLFVNENLTPAGDFHLTEGSPCISQGTGSAEMGAYGGPSADTIPFQVQNVVVSATSTTPADATINWTKNLAHNIGGYKVYYGNPGSASGVYDGTVALEGASPITVPTGTTASTFQLSSLPAATVAPAAPVLGSSQVLNNTIIVSWSQVPGATAYRVYYGTANPPTTFADAGNKTSLFLSGLTNGQTYYFFVTAVAQATYHIAMTAFDTSTGPFSPGIGHESAFSTEFSVNVGAALEGPPSLVGNDFPEAVVAYPNLPDSNKGCFIATAAYGFYSDSHVQALRRFRDRFLLTNAPGRAFVAWYYANGPEAAAWLNEHPAYKPAIRAALLPAVGLSLFLTGTPILMQILIFVLLAAALAFVVFRKRPATSGGNQ